MQNPNEDTEWNDILRQKGIIPEKKKDVEITEDQIVNLLESTVNERTGKVGNDLENKTLDELDELEDEETEEVIAEYRRQRIREMKALAEKSKFGEVKEITAVDYINEVTKAEEGIYVILHLYKSGIPLCSLVNQHLSALARKFPTAKFLKSISTTCIPNYPDHNLPTIFIFKDGQMVEQMVGPIALRGMNLSVKELEYMLGKTGAIPTTVKNDPKQKVRDVLMSKLGVLDSDDDAKDDLSDDNDW